MATQSLDELTACERGILATNAVARYLDDFSRQSRRLVTASATLVRRTRTYYSRGQEFVVEWQDYGQPLALWFDPLMQGFADLLTLPKNWNSYGAEPISRNLIDAALEVMNDTLAQTSPAPRVVPLSSGGLQLEWRRKGIDLEIIFDRNESPYFYFRNRETGEESDYELVGNRQILQAVIATLE